MTEQNNNPYIIKYTFKEYDDDCMGFSAWLETPDDLKAFAMNFFTQDGLTELDYNSYGYEEIEILEKSVTEGTFEFKMLADLLMDPLEEYGIELEFCKSLEELMTADNSAIQSLRKTLTESNDPTPTEKKDTFRTAMNEHYTNKTFILIDK